MTPFARTPEDLEMLLEDAFVTRDPRHLTGLFESNSVLVDDRTGEVARGSDELAGLAASLWARDHLYLARPRRVVQARNTALLLAPGLANVVRRHRDGGWHFAISILSYDPTAEAQRP